MKVLRTIFGPKVYKINGNLRMFHDVEVYDVFRSLDTKIQAVVMG
jgi:hypothetical protein